MCNCFTTPLCNCFTTLVKFLHIVVQFLHIENRINIARFNVVFRALRDGDKPRFLQARQVGDNTPARTFRTISNVLMAGPALPFLISDITESYQN